MQSTFKKLGDTYKQVGDYLLPDVEVPENPAIRIVGKASDVGTLEPTDKCRGEAKSLNAIMKHLKESGLKTGKVILAHCLNESAAKTLKNMIETDLPGVVVKIGRNLGLCSYYAEKRGLLVGFEKS